MLVKFLRFKVIVLPLTKMCILSLVAGAGDMYLGGLHYYQDNAIFNINLILSVVGYPHNNMCCYKASCGSSK